MTPLILDYLDAQPGVTVRALLADRIVSMADEGIDVAIRIGELQDSGLHAVRAGSVRRVVCGAPQFLQRYGIPRHPDQLPTCRVIAASAVTQTAEWRFVEAGASLSVRIRTQFSVTSNRAAIVAACRGWGLTRVLSYQIAPQLESGALAIVLADFEPPPLPIHVVYQHGRKLPAKVRSFVDFCVAGLRADQALNPS